MARGVVRIVRGGGALRVDFVLRAVEHCAARECHVRRAGDLVLALGARRAVQLELQAVGALASDVVSCVLERTEAAERHTAFIDVDVLHRLAVQQHNCVAEPAVPRRVKLRLDLRTIAAIWFFAVLVLLRVRQPPSPVGWSNSAVAGDR